MLPKMTVLSEYFPGNHPVIIGGWADQVHIRDLEEDKDVPDTLYGVVRVSSSGWYGEAAFVSYEAAESFAKTQTNENADYFVRRLQRNNTNRHG